MTITSGHSSRLRLLEIILGSAFNILFLKNTQTPVSPSSHSRGPFPNSAGAVTQSPVPWWRRSGIRLWLGWDCGGFLLYWIFLSEGGGSGCPLPPLPRPLFVSLPYTLITSTSIFSVPLSFTCLKTLTYFHSHTLLVHVAFPSLDSVVCFYFTSILFLSLFFQFCPFFPSIASPLTLSISPLPPLSLSPFLIFSFVWTFPSPCCSVSVSFRAIATLLSL